MVQQTGQQKGQPGESENAYLYCLQRGTGASHSHLLLVQLVLQLFQLLADSFLCCALLIDRAMHCIALVGQVCQLLLCRAYYASGMCGHRGSLQTDVGCTEGRH